MRKPLIRNIVREIIQEVIDNSEQEQIRNFIKGQSLKFAQEIGAEIVNEEFISLYHGTNPANAKKIIQSGRFNSGTFFSNSNDDAVKFGKQSMSRGEPHIFKVVVWAGSLMPTGHFLSLRENVYLKDGVYVPEYMK